VALRRAEAHSLNLGAALQRLATGATVGAEDLAAVLHGRVERWARARIDPARPVAGALVAGLIPVPANVRFLSNDLMGGHGQTTRCCCTTMGEHLVGRDR
jgi:hypothetical protein